MKFKKYVKESVETPKKFTLSEGLGDPDTPTFAQQALDSIYEPIKKLIKDGKYDEATAKLDELDADIDQMEQENSKRRLFKWPKFIIDGQRKQVAAIRATIPSDNIEESIHDMDKRCEKCNTLLNDRGTCPKCDDGEEDYDDSDDISEELTNREKLQKAYPELNFTKPVTEEISDSGLSVREKLKAAYPELNFNDEVTEAIEDSWYDDDYDIEDDVELDRVHASLYGGDRMYCDCGKRLVMDEWGSYCPECNPKDPSEIYNESVYSSECEYTSKETSYDIAHEIAQLAKKALRLPLHEVEMLEHDINNLRSTEWIDSFAKLSDNSPAKQMFFEYAVQKDDCYEDVV